MQKRHVRPNENVIRNATIDSFDCEYMKDDFSELFDVKCIEFHVKYIEFHVKYIEFHVKHIQLHTNNITPL